MAEIYSVLKPGCDDAGSVMLFVTHTPEALETRTFFLVDFCSSRSVL